MPMTGSYPNYLVVVLALFGAVVACGCMAADGGDTAADRISGNGTIAFVDLEGGFYGIVADDGERYLPADLPAEYRQDDLRVRFVVDVLEDTATIQQWGTPVEIVEIEKGDARRTVAANGTVTYVDLEGGFYGIVADDGERYLPLDLNETYRVDGMRLTFVGEVARDTATIQQWGTPVEIIDVPWACARCGGNAGIANPAAVWCTEQGHTYEIRKNSDGSEYGVCIFGNGTEVDAWDYYRQTH
ncbi:MAG: hypothetical protein PWR21_564 [Methanoculleus sp.]|nr:hypothetical protein [Methanoculleus sp.]